MSDIVLIGCKSNVGVQYVIAAHATSNNEGTPLRSARGKPNYLNLDGTLPRRSTWTEGQGYCPLRMPFFYLLNAGDSYKDSS